MRPGRLKSVLITCLLAAFAGPAFGGTTGCNNTMFNPVTDVPWNAIFPLRVGGIAVKQNRDLPDTNEGRSGSPMCACTNATETYLGLKASFYQLDTMAEVVRTPYCSPTVGTAFSSLDNGYHGGTNSMKTDSPKTFKQVHWLRFPVFDIVGMLTDSSCIKHGEGFDYLMFSELDPTHNKSYLAAVLDPRVFLFASPPFDLVCSASRGIAMLPGEILTGAFNSLFWCCFENVYSLTGDKNNSADTESSVAIASKTLYKLSSTGLHMDLTSNVCQPTVRPFWKKGDYRWALAKPVTMSKPIICDTPGFLWDGNKNYPYKEGNYLWLLFQKKICCQKVKGAN
jgi:conjugal transfer pilus assembly protein TraU